ncbi:hypothetical protein KV557_09940 [Kitasatospora aureofaciens]|uniref:hypothetical protein n=1 Tax=Kitasatospora aureofaciens TaxID=1894 RepID=UPI001C45AE86|nr:hypothetical protein [Kitasatospora aureofaciens]MBV6697444.1 hypothetical protein [Kitasatospora aureofaciens]
MARAPLVTSQPPDPTVVYVTGPQAISASGDSGALNTSGIAAALLSVFVAGATGTTPSLAVYFDVQDAAGQWITTATLTAITSGPNFAFAEIGPGSGGYLITGTGRVRWVVSGTTPSFTGVTMSLIGR